MSMIQILCLYVSVEIFSSFISMELKLLSMAIQTVSVRIFHLTSLSCFNPDYEGATAELTKLKMKSAARHMIGLWSMPKRAGKVISRGCYGTLLRTGQKLLNDDQWFMGLLLISISLLAAIIWWKYNSLFYLTNEFWCKPATWQFCILCTDNDMTGVITRWKWKN